MLVGVVVTAATGALAPPVKLPLKNILPTNKLANLCPVNPNVELLFARGTIYELAVNDPTVELVVVLVTVVAVVALVALVAVAAELANVALATRKLATVVVLVTTKGAVPVATLDINCLPVTFAFDTVKLVVPPAVTVTLPFAVAIFTLLLPFEILVTPIIPVNKLPLPI